VRRAVLALAAACLAGAGQAAAAPTRTPIRHVITLMQENHSFDNYFGTYPGADGVPPHTCMPLDPGNGARGCVRPFHIGGRAVTALRDDQATFAGQLAGGRMNGFLDVFRRRGVDGTIAMGHYDARDIPFYWNVADQYVLFDRFFASAPSGALRNHLEWMTATAGTPAPTTIFDRLQARHVSWKVYVQNYDLAAFRRKPSRLARLPLLAYPRYVHNRRLLSHIVGLDQLYADLRDGTLPAVSYVVPSGAGEHPPASIQAGQRLVHTLVAALMRSSDWRSSAFLWTYDGWGGWYDHVRPPRGDGFRVPALLVSAYGRRGYVDSTQLDFTSILRFIEANWSLPPLARRDAHANSLSSAFDFSHGPRPARFIAAERGSPLGPEPRRSVIYALYGAALALATLVVGWAALGRRRRVALTAEVGR
jgi:phospholipase C